MKIIYFEDDTTLIDNYYFKMNFSLESDYLFIKESSAFFMIAGVFIIRKNDKYYTRIITYRRVNKIFEDAMNDEKLQYYLDKNKHYKYKKFMRYI